MEPKETVIRHEMKKITSRNKDSLLGRVKCGEIYRNVDGQVFYTCFFCDKTNWQALEFENHLLLHFRAKLIEKVVPFEGSQAASTTFMKLDIEMLDSHIQFKDEFADVTSEVSFKDEDDVACKQEELDSDPSDSGRKELIEDKDTTYQGMETQQFHRAQEATKTDHDNSDTHDLEVTKPAPTTNKRRNRQWFCKSCHQMYTSFKVYREHMRTYHPTEFTCDICGYKCLLKGNIRAHVQIHCETKTYKCDICSKYFGHKSDFKVHRRYHLNERPYLCNLCGKAYTASSSLNIHMKTHGVTPYKLYRCTMCDYLTVNSTSLKNHKRKHTGEKPFACDDCPATFGALQILKQHQHLHLTEKRFQCHYCDAKFHQKAGKRGHEKRMHENVIVSSSYEIKYG